MVHSIDEDLVLNKIKASLKQIPLIIKHCFPEYTLDELELTPLPKQIELFSKAKWMLENLELVKLEFEEEDKK